MERSNELCFNSIPMEREVLHTVFTGCVNYSSIHLISIQSGTHSASMDTQRELQSAAHTFYQQVVRVLKQRAAMEREHPGLLIFVPHFTWGALCCSPLVIFHTNVDLILNVVELLSLLHPGSCQHLLLATMFALNFCYQPIDLVLVIKCGILEILSMLTSNSCALMNQGWFAASTSGSMLLSGAVKLACTRLLQILTVASRWGWRDCKYGWKLKTDWKCLHFCNKWSCALSSCEDLLPLEVSHALMEVMCEQLQNILYTFHQQQTAERGTTERTDPDTSSKSANLIGIANLTTLNFTFYYVL